MIDRDSSGRFVRTLKEWSLENFDEGWIDSNGRFRVCKPEHPRADIHGHVLRAIVAYETYHNELVTRDFEIHHKDRNKLNDSEVNLEKLTNSQHQKIHKGSDVTLLCEICGKAFEVSQWRVTERLKETGSNPRFCGQTCYHASRRIK